MVSPTFTPQGWTNPLFLGLKSEMHRSDFPLFAFVQSWSACINNLKPKPAPFYKQTLHVHGKAKAFLRVLVFMS